MKPGILALNIVDTTLNGYQIINTRGPLLFYYDASEYESKINLMKNKDFMEYLEKHNVLTNISIYLNTHLACVSMEDINNDNFSEQTINIKDVFPFTKENTITFIALAKEVLTVLYYKIHNKQIEGEKLSDLSGLYKQLYKDAMTFVNKETFDLYIRGYIQEYYPQLSNEEVNNFTDYIKNL